jgi:hypothetical protein
MTRMVDAIIPVPATPRNRSATEHPSPANPSPPLPSPSDISRYLNHASEKLGVRSAQAFVSPLKRKSYGPDILSQVPDSDLAGLGIPPGDIIRLKNGSEGWWKKQKQVGGKGPDANSFNQDQQKDEEEEETVGYEYKYPDGGGVHYSGPPMIRGDQGPHDSSTTYYNQACHARLPIPLGFTASPYGDPEADPNYWR